MNAQPHASKTLFDLFPIILLPFFTEWIRPNEFLQLIRSLGTSDIKRLKSEYYDKISHRTKLAEFFFAKRDIITTQNLWGIEEKEVFILNKVFRVKPYLCIRTEFDNSEWRIMLLNLVAKYSEIVIDIPYVDRFSFFDPFMNLIVPSLRNLVRLHLTGEIVRRRDLLVRLLANLSLSELTIECENMESLLCVIVYARSLTSLRFLGPRLTSQALCMLGFHVCRSLISFQTNACKYSDVALWTLMNYRGGSLQTLSLDRTRFLCKQVHLGLYTGPPTPNTWLEMTSLTLSLCDGLSNLGLTRLLGLFPALQSLSIKCSKFSVTLNGQVVQDILTHCGNLQKLIIDGLRIGAVHQNVSVVKCNKLESIKLPECNLTDKLLMSVLQSQIGFNLKSVDISKNENITPSALLQSESSLQALIELNLQFCKYISDELLTSLLTPTSPLEYLNVSGCVLVTEVGLLFVLHNCLLLRTLMAEYLKNCNMEAVIDCIIDRQIYLDKLFLTTSSEVKYDALENRLKKHYPEIKVYIRSGVRDATKQYISPIVEPSTVTVGLVGDISSEFSGMDE